MSKRPDAPLTPERMEKIALVAMAMVNLGVALETMSDEDIERAEKLAEGMLDAAEAESSEEDSGKPN